MSLLLVFMYFMENGIENRPSGGPLVADLLVFLESVGVDFLLFSGSAGRGDPDQTGFVPGGSIPGSNGADLVPLAGDPLDLG